MKRHVLLGSALACFALVWAATPAHAQLFRGRGGSGGFGYGNYGNTGYSPGYGNWGGYGYGNPGYSNYGNWGSGWNHYGSSPYYGSGWNYGYNPSYGSNYGTNWGSNTWGGGWGQNYNWSGQGYNTVQPGYGYASSGQNFYDGSGYTSQGSNQGFTGQQANHNEAMVRVMVPAPDAQVSIDGHQTQQQGMERTFITPTLQQNGGTYKISATWTEGGRQVQRERTVQVRPGQHATVNFMDSQDQNRSQGSATQFDERDNFQGNRTDRKSVV